MIRKHGCLGFRILRLGRHQLELWFCPANAWIPPHVHRNIDNRLVMLGGSMHGSIGKDSGRVGWLDFLRVFKVPAGVEHAAFVLWPFCVFASWETWKRGECVTSAAMDFSEV